MADLANQFREAMLNLYEQSRKEANYRPTMLLRWTQELGGVEAARKMLTAGDKNGVSSGITKLYEAGRMDLTVEALMLKPEYRELFTEAELAEAHRILSDFEYKAPWDRE